MSGRRGLTGRTRVVGVWGHPVGHSRSPAMQNAALDALGLDWVYIPFEVAPERVAEAVAGVRALGLVGVNVTVPLKEAVLPYLDVVDEAASRIGAVNTIHNVDGVLHGYSTDGEGFLRALQAAGEPVDDRRVYLLGAGGSARAVAFALAARGGRIAIANRTRARAQELADRINCFYDKAAAATEWGAQAGEFDLLVNATSLGMTPREHTMPALPPGNLRPGQSVFDLVYTPPETNLLALARRSGCRVANGITMLVYQGALALSIWTGLPVDAMPTEAMEAAVRASLGVEVAG